MAYPTDLILGVLTGDQNARSPFIRSLLRTAREQGIFAFSFTPRNIAHMETPAIQGAVSTEAEIARFMPLPTVVYNRLPTRRAEASAEAERMKRMFRRQGIPYFNSRFFNKREMDRALRKDPSTAKLLPETLVAWDELRMHQMLSTYGALFIKPIGGSFGDGICRLVKDISGYRLEVRQSFGTFGRYFDSWQECVDACRAQMGGVSSIIQEEIPLAKFDGSKTDFRVHVHRRVDDAWEVVGIGAKVGKPDAITTHVHSGGRVEDAHMVFRSWFGRQASDRQEELAQIASSICRQLVRRIDPHLGEVGLDMGIAEDRRIILFEANAKPGRMIFRHKSLRRAGALSRLRIVQYASHMVGQIEMPFLDSIGMRDEGWQ